MTDTLAILPARGGSKRIPRKNIRPFSGKPAIAWPIETLAKSDLVSRLVVSTDDPEIAQVAETCGAEAPFLRAAHLADDHAGTLEVVRDAVERLDPADDTIVFCVYPTAFFLTVEDIARGMSAMQANARWALTIARYPTPIERAYRQVGSVLQPCDPEKMQMRSQDLAPAFFDAGQMYVARAATWRDTETQIWDGPKPIEIPFARAIDIDTEDDWLRAEAMVDALRGTS